MSKFANVVAAASFALTTQAFAIEQFSAPWMNHTPVIDFHSADHPHAVFVIDNMQAGCGACRTNETIIEPWAQQYLSNERVVILALSYDQDEEEYQSWFQKFTPPFPVLKDEKHKIYQALGSHSLPTTYVLDCNLNIRYKAASVWTEQIKKDVDNMIATVLAEPNCQN